MGSLDDRFYKFSAIVAVTVLLVSCVPAPSVDETACTELLAAVDRINVIMDNPKPDKFEIRSAIGAILEIVSEIETIEIANRDFKRANDEFTTSIHILMSGISSALDGKVGLNNLNQFQADFELASSNLVQYCD